MPTTTIYARLNELYLLSSKINKVTYDSQSWDELLQGVCRGLTEQGHYKHVWIGKYQSDTNSIVAITQYGMVDELASEIFLNDPGLTGIQQLLFNTIRSKCVQSCDNLSSTELELCVRGSAVVAPLFQQNELYGVILFYDGSPEIFSNHDIILCEETARGLSGALNRFMPI